MGSPAVLGLAVAAPPEVGVPPAVRSGQQGQEGEQDRISDLGLGLK